MTKEFIITDGADINETIEDMTFKKAVKKFQSKNKVRRVWVKRTTKRGKEVETSVRLPIGRKKKLGRW